MEQFYYHGIQEGADGIMTMLRILKSESIQSKRLLQYASEGGFNGLDYVSVCKWNPKDMVKKDSSFPIWIQNHFCMILSQNTPATKTNYLPGGRDLSQSDLKAFLDTHRYERYSDVADEWQVKDEIPSEYWVGVGLPTKWILEEISHHLDRTHLLALKELLEVANALGLDLVDSSRPHFVEEYEKQYALKGKKYRYE